MKRNRQDADKLPMASRWPTELDENNTAPPNIMVVADGDSHLQRQAMYQLQAATQLQDRGYHIESLQQPLGRTAPITIPIVVNTQAGAPAAVYTQSEPWNVERRATSSSRCTRCRCWLSRRRTADSR